MHVFARGCAILTVIGGLAACGTTPEERVITGAGLGAAGGAIIGAVTGLTVLQAALIGTGVGGATGLLTDESMLDLGRPIWETLGLSPSNDRATQTAWSEPKSSNTVAEAQGALNQLGYRAGQMDGIMGPKTRSAIEEYQFDKGLQVDGRLTASLSERLRREATF